MKVEFLCRNVSENEGFGYGLVFSESKPFFYIDRNGMVSLYENIQDCIDRYLRDGGNK